MKPIELPPVDCSLDKVKAEIRTALQYVPTIAAFHAPFVVSIAQLHEIAHVVVSCILVMHGYSADRFNKEDLNECQLIQEYIDLPLMEELQA